MHAAAGIPSGSDQSSLTWLPLRPRKRGPLGKRKISHVKPIYLQGLHAVKVFAGESYHMAVTYPDDEEFELLFDPYVFQHVVEIISPL